MRRTTLRMVVSVPAAVVVLAGCGAGGAGGSQGSTTSDGTTAPVEGAAPAPTTGSADVPPPTTPSATPAPSATAPAPATPPPGGPAAAPGASGPWYASLASDAASLGLVAAAGDAAGDVVVLARAQRDDGSASLVVAAFDASGALAWRAAADADPAALAVAPDGTVTAVGSAGGDAFVARWAAGGALAWSRRDAGWVPRDVAIDGRGGAVVAGSDAGALRVLAYDAEGSARWSARDDGPRHAGARGRRVALDDAGGAVVVAGESSDGTTEQRTVWRFDAAAGALAWSSRDDEDATLVPQTTSEALAVRGGRTYLAGTRAVRVTHDAEPSIELSVSAYDATGAALWTTSQAPAPRTVPTALAVDENGRIAVTGFAGAAGPESYFTVQLDPTGAVRWSARDAWSAPGAHRANAVAIDARGDVIVTGSAIDAAGVSSFGTLAYSPDGSVLFRDAFRDPGGAYTAGGALVIDARSGAARVAGSVLASPRGVVGVRSLRAAE